MPRYWDDTDLRYIEVEVIFSGGGPVPWATSEGWRGYQSPICNARPYRNGELISLDAIRDKGSKGSPWAKSAAKKRKAA